MSHNMAFQRYRHCWEQTRRAFRMVKSQHWRSSQSKKAWTTNLSSNLYGVTHSWQFLYDVDKLLVRSKSIDSVLQKDSTSQSFCEPKSYTSLNNLCSFANKGDVEWLTTEASVLRASQWKWLIHLNVKEYNSCFQYGGRSTTTKRWNSSLEQDHWIWAPFIS